MAYAEELDHFTMVNDGVKPQLLEKSTAYSVSCFFHTLFVKMDGAINCHFYYVPP